MPGSDSRTGEDRPHLSCRDLLTGPPFFCVLSTCDTQMEKPYRAMHPYRGSTLIQSPLTGHGQRELSCGRSWDELFVGGGCPTCPGITRESTQPFPLLRRAGGVHHSPADYPWKLWRVPLPAPSYLLAPSPCFIFSPLLLGLLFQGAWIARTGFKSL